jgi:hypothetical protein
MAKSDKLYDASPTLERGADGNMKVGKKEPTKMGEDKKLTEDKKEDEDLSSKVDAILNKAREEIVKAFHDHIDSAVHKEAK